MGVVVNLNKVRKARDKRLAEARANVNRTRFGQPKEELSNARKDAETAKSDLDGKRLD